MNYSYNNDFPDNIDFYTSTQIIYYSVGHGSHYTDWKFLPRLELIQRLFLEYGYKSPRFKLHGNAVCTAFETHITQDQDSLFDK